MLEPRKSQIYLFLNPKSHSNNEKATEAYRLFSEGKKPVQVAIELNLKEGQVNKFLNSISNPA